MKRELTDQEIFTRLAEGKAVQAADGAVYFCAEGRLVYDSEWNWCGFSCDFEGPARVAFTACKRPLKRTYKHLLNRRAS